MRSIVSALVATVTLAWLAPVSAARAQGFAAGPLRGQAVAQLVRVGASSVHVAGRRVWRPRSPGERIITGVVKSRSGAAVAFATRCARGEVTLFVVLLGPEVHGHVMTWPIPARARRAGKANVMWLGERRVGFGYSPVRPAVVASWRLRR